MWDRVCTAVFAPAVFRAILTGTYMYCVHICMYMYVLVHICIVYTIVLRILYIVCMHTLTNNAYYMTHIYEYILILYTVCYVTYGRVSKDDL